MIAAILVATVALLGAITGLYMLSLTRKPAVGRHQAAAQPEPESLLLEPRADGGGENAAAAYFRELLAGHDPAVPAVADAALLERVRDSLAAMPVSPPDKPGPDLTGSFPAIREPEFHPATSDEPAADPDVTSAITHANGTWGKTVTAMVDALAAEHMEGAGK